MTKYLIVLIFSAFSAAAAAATDFHKGDAIYATLLSGLAVETTQKDSPAIFELTGSPCRLLAKQTTSNNKLWFVPSRLICDDMSVDVSSSIAIVRLDYRVPYDSAATTAEFAVVKDIVFPKQP